MSRVLERMLREQGFVVEQASDTFGERTDDTQILEWAGEHGWLLVTNDAKDFHRLHDSVDHAGLLVFSDQSLRSDDPEGLARTVDEVLSQYGVDGVANELVDLEEWYDWIHGE